MKYELGEDLKSQIHNLKKNEKFSKINANLVQNAGFVKACFSSSKIAREYIQILKMSTVRLILQAFRNLIFWFIFQFWMRMNLTKIGLLSKLIAGDLVFQASTELVLQDFRKPGKFETDSSFYNRMFFFSLVKRVLLRLEIRAW